MRRATVLSAVTAVLASFVVPAGPFDVAAAAVASSVESPVVVTGDGDGLSGPASRARVQGVTHVTLAADGSVLVVEGGSLLRVDPVGDRATVVESYDPAAGRGAVDVAVLGATTYLLTPWGLDRLDAGQRTRLWTGRAEAVDVGADGVAWLASDQGVTRVLPDGSAVGVPGTDLMDATDIAVTGSGSTAYVLDHAPQRHGVYEVTASGVGPRVAGTGYRSDSLREGQPATDASMEAVQGISLEGSTLTVASGEYRLLATFTIGGVVHVRANGGYTGSVDSAAGTTVAVQDNGSSVVRLPSTGTAGATRVLGADPARPWSPDGVLASDAYTGPLRGAAAIDSTRFVFTTGAGLVRDVDAQGRLHTLATLPAITARGKVAASADGTAYVVDDGGHVLRVTSTGAVLTLPVAADATDVEVLPDGRLLVADASPARVLLTQPDGSGASVLATLPDAPTDLGLDGDTVLVADSGLHRVGLDGTVATLLSGGRPTTALRGRDGIWTGQLHVPDTSAMVLQAGGGLGALRSLFDTGRQAQADSAGTVLVTRADSVLRVTDATPLPPQTGPAVTATPGEGRVVLTTADGNPAQGIIRTKRGTAAPRDPWDGVDAGTSSPVFRIGGQLVAPGEQWTFAVFRPVPAGAGGGWEVTSYTSGAVATAAADPDDTPPPPPVEPHLYTDHEQVRLTYYDPSPWQDPAADDFDRTVVRYALGTTPPASPTAGIGLGAGEGTLHDVSIPDPVRGQQYAIAVFALDLRGNASRWTAVTQLDYQPPGVVTGVSVSPSYRTASVALVLPADDDLEGVAWAVATGDQAPVLPADASFVPWSQVTADGLSMDMTYTLALWTRDRAGNVSAPATTTFRTLLDSVPPGPVSALTASGGSYSITATWTNPTDRDFGGPVPELVDPATGLTAPCPMLNYTRTSCSWRVKGDATRTVRVRARDVNGNLSPSVETTATSLPDSNGTPSIPEPVSWSAVDPTTVTVRFPKPTYVDLAALWYVLRPVGQPTAPPLANGTLSGSGSAIATPVTLPDATQSYDLYLYVQDLNGNRGERVLTGVHGGPDPAGRPSMPGNVQVTAPVDNTIKVTWSTPSWTASVTTWVATATSADGSLVRTVSVPGGATNLGIGDLAGRQTWTVRLHGENALGSGASSLPQGVQVGDSTAPARVAGLSVAPAYDTATLRWTNPDAFDLAKVVVLRRERTSGAVVTLYSGRGTSVRSTGLVAGRSYGYEVRSYDLLGNVSLPTTLTTNQTAVSLAASSIVRYGSSVRASGSLSQSGRGLAGRSVSLFAQRVGTTTWSRVASATTSATGTFAITVKPAVSTRYRVGYAGSGTTGGSYSVVRTVTTSPIVAIRTSRTSLSRGASVTLGTTVSPNHAGRSITLQRWSGTRWVTLTRRTLSRTSTASVTIRPTVRGYNSYRWYLPAHTDHGTGTSATARVRVY